MTLADGATIRVELRISEVLHSVAEPDNDLFRTEMRQPMTPPDDTREFLTEMFGQIGERFDRVDERFDRVGERFDGVDARLDGVDARLDGIETKFDSVTVALIDAVADINKRLS